MKFVEIYDEVVKKLHVHRIFLEKGGQHQNEHVTHNNLRAAIYFIMLFVNLVGLDTILSFVSLSHAEYQKGLIVNYTVKVYHNWYCGINIIIVNLMI